MAYTFTLETDNNRRGKYIALAVIALIFIGGGIIAFTTGSVGQIQISLGSFFTGDAHIGAVGLFLAGFIGGLFFIPLPQELIFYAALQNGTPPLSAAIATIAGYMCSQLFNYLVGVKLSKYVTYLVSTQKLYSLRRTVNKWGAWAIIIANIVPMPAPVLTFAVGIAKYNMIRLFLSLLVSNVLKYGLIIAFFMLVA